MNTRILTKNDIAEARTLLKAGRNVIFPTETVYGLGASIDSEEALKHIFIAKGRPQDNPLIIHIGKKERIEDIFSVIPEETYKLIDAFWPGPLTIVLPKKESVSDTVSAGLKTVGVRMPSHPVALELLGEDLFVAAPSANPSGYPSPTKASHTLEMEGKVDAIIMDGDCDVGLESTVYDVLGKRILRPGAVTLEDIRTIVPDASLYEGQEKTASPGRMYKHYAPKTPVYFLEGSVEEQRKFIENEITSAFLVDDILYTKEERIRRFLPEGNLFEASKHFYELLRELDEKGYDAIYIPKVERTGIGLALMDRMMRSTEHKTKRLGGENEDHSRK
ncbi:L-threonylcarbamoyladenylate synthase [Guggenheimella bovis]